MNMKKIAVAIGLLAGAASSDAMDFAFSNGLLDMKRDIVLKLVRIIGTKRSQVRAVIGIGQESYDWKAHWGYVQGRVATSRTFENFALDLIDWSLAIDDEIRNQLASVSEKKYGKKVNLLSDDTHVELFRAVNQLILAKRETPLGVSPSNDCLASALARKIRHDNNGNVNSRMGYKLLDNADCDVTIQSVIDIMDVDLNDPDTLSRLSKYGSGTWMAKALLTRLKLDEKVVAGNLKTLLANSPPRTYAPLLARSGVNLRDHTVVESLFEALPENAYNRKCLLRAIVRALAKTPCAKLDENSVLYLFNLCENRYDLLWTLAPPFLSIIAWNSSDVGAKVRGPFNTEVHQVAT